MTINNTESPLTTTEPISSIAHYADIFQGQQPPILCVGENWLEGRNGTFVPVTKHKYRPLVQKLLPPLEESSRKALDILDTIEGRHQVGESQLSTFARRDGQNVMLLNCRNGVLKVTPNSIQLMKHDLSFRFTRQIAAAYNPDAGSSEFTRVVTHAVKDADGRRLLLIFAAYALLPDCSGQHPLICCGPDRTGMEAIWKVLASVMGTHLVTHLSMHELSSAISCYLPHLQSAALNVTSGLGSDAVVEGELLRKLLSGKPVEPHGISGMPAAPKDYPTKFAFLCNNPPNFKNATQDELRSLRFIKFDGNPEKADPLLETKLAAEKDGIFSNLLVPRLQEGLRKLVSPQVSPSSKDTMNPCTAQTDALGAFLSDRCVLDPDKYTEKDVLYDAFKNWAREKNVRSRIKEQFFRELRNRHRDLVDYRRRIPAARLRYLRGIGLKPI